MTGPPFRPKGTDLSGCSQADLDDVAAMLAERLRKAPGWCCQGDR